MSKLSEQYREFENGQRDEQSLRNLRGRLLRREKINNAVGKLGFLPLASSLALQFLGHPSPLEQNLSLVLTGIGGASILGSLFNQGNINYKLDNVERYMQAHQMVAQQEEAQRFLGSRYLWNHPEDALALAAGGLSALAFSPLFLGGNVDWQTSIYAGLAGATGGALTGLMVRGVRKVKEMNRDRF